MTPRRMLAVVILIFRKRRSWNDVFIEMNVSNMEQLNHTLRVESKFRYKKSPTLGIFYVKYILAGKNGKREINIIITRSWLFSRNSLRN